MFLWDIDQIESDILLKYASGQPLAMKNTKRLYYEHDVEADVNRWLAWIVLHDFDIKVDVITPVPEQYLRDQIEVARLRGRSSPYSPKINQPKTPGVVGQNPKLIS